mmetsp:Transcript_15509/g.31820  ORF Transcript_15509/g.31820 Transcript_15509/m.31820 type:complete len:258 (-) Transcript_15509:74-847(-)
MDDDQVLANQEDAWFLPRTIADVVERRTESASRRGEPRHQRILPGTGERDAAQKRRRSSDRRRCRYPRFARTGTHRWLRQGSPLGRTLGGTAGRGLARGGRVVHTVRPEFCGFGRRVVQVSRTEPGMRGLRFGSNERGRDPVAKVDPHGSHGSREGRTSPGFVQRNRDDVARTQWRPLAVPICGTVHTYGFGTEQITTCPRVAGVPFSAVKGVIRASMMQKKAVYRASLVGKKAREFQATNQFSLVCTNSTCTRPGG